MLEGGSGRGGRGAGDGDGVGRGGGSVLACGVDAGSAACQEHQGEGCEHNWQDCQIFISV